MYWIQPDLNDVKEGLESWDWIDFSGLVPFAVTAFGDVFFEGKGDIFFLDKVAGELENICDSKSDLEEILKTEEGRDHFLMFELVELANKSGLVLENDECYEFNIPPMLSGTMDLDNLGKMSFKVSLHVTGQLIGQVRDLPEGTAIPEVKLESS